MIYPSVIHEKMDGASTIAVKTDTKIFYLVSIYIIHGLGPSFIMRF